MFKNPTKYVKYLNHSRHAYQYFKISLIIRN